MIQEIGTHQMAIAYQNQQPTATDYIVILHEDEAYFKKGSDEEGNLTFYTYEELHTVGPIEYLFAIDQQPYYVAYELDVERLQEVVRVPLAELRGFQPRWMAFACITASQILRFRKKNLFCGCCGSPMKNSAYERACICTQCSNIVYPKISPAVIVGITNGNQLLLTRYARGSYQKYGLVAGFTEVGETLEETVRREVMEEVGLRVENIRYYKNQPWAFSDSLLVGFFAEVEGDPTVTLEEEELAEAIWVEREELPWEDTTKASLTQEMIGVFREK